MAKIRIEEIKQKVEEAGWKLITQQYNNLDTEMTFECPEGHRVFAPWKKIRDKFECPVCKKNVLVKMDGEVKTKPKGATRILAVDQASHISGYAIFDDGKLIKYGTFRTELADEIARISMVKTWLLSMIENWKPDRIALEGIQFQEESGGQKMSVTVFQTLARLQGVLMETCFFAKIPYEVCPTNTWRHSCGVKGRSRTDKKRSMQLLAKQWYDITISEDEADAIGIGHHMVGNVVRNTTVTNWET